MRVRSEASTSSSTDNAAPREQAAARSNSSAISITLAHALLEAADAHDVQRQRLQAAARCALGERDHVLGWVDLDSFSRLIEAAVQHTRDPALGLHWGERAPSTNFGIVASLALWSPSPRTALTALLNFQGLLIRGFPAATFQTRDQTAVMRFDLSPFQQRTARRVWAEFAVVGTTLLLRHLCGHARCSTRATFDHAAPVYAQEYRRILGDQVAFERDACTVELDSACLDRAVPMFNQRLSEAVLNEARTALARSGSEPPESMRVREQLAAAGTRVPNMEQVARKLGMSSRTLRRHLEQEGVAFPTLVAEALRERAMRLLGDPRTPVKEVAYALGFATQSAFHRAFKRWTGSSPSAVRVQRSLAGQP